MADSSYGFRSALGGFHKGDVTGYIERTLAQHRSELLDYEATVTSLREENRSLQQQLNLLLMAMPDLASVSTETPAETPIETPASAPVHEPVVTPEPAVTPEPVVVSEPAPTPEVEAPVNNSTLITAELQAYRRAEAVERNAAKRARNIYHQLENACEGTLDKFKDTDAAFKQAIELIQEQATALEQAYHALSLALDGSRENLASVNDLLPDEVAEQ